jgi:hypothetical protein
MHRVGTGWSVVYLGKYNVHVFSTEMAHIVFALHVLQKVTLHVFCTSILEFYELLNETIFKSLGDMCTVLLMN